MDMINEKTLRIAFVISFLLFLMTLVTLNKSTMNLNKQTQELQSLKLQRDSLKKLSDSLYDENFPCQIEIGRYQVAYQIFMERNPKAASQYGDIISNETE